MPQPDSFNSISENFMDCIVKNEKSIYISRRKILIKGYFQLKVMIIFQLLLNVKMIMRQKIENLLCPPKVKKEGFKSPLLQ